MKKTLALVVAAAMGLSSVVFAADAATAAPANSTHVSHHHAKAKKTVAQKAQAAKKQVKSAHKKAPVQKAQAAKKTHKHAKQQKKAAH